jgi:hypothetical protein
MRLPGSFHCSARFAANLDRAQRRSSSGRGRMLMANLEVADETAERVLGHSLGGLMETYNVSRHRKQYNLVSWAQNSFGVPLDDFLPGSGP